MDAGTATADPAAPHADWSGDGARWRLQLAGDWRGHGGGLPAPPPALREGELAVDASRLTGWDARLAAALWQRLAALPTLVVDLQGLPPRLRQALHLALPERDSATSAAAPARLPKPPNPLQRAERTLTFVGDVLLSTGRLLRGRGDLRAADLAWQFEQTGPRSLPVVALVCFLVGLILAYMGAAQLVRFGAQTYIADLVTVGVVREIAALLVGIVLAGRVGAAFAAQLGSMGANEEIDALRAMGIDPVSHLVLPRVLALLVVGPLLTAFGAFVGLLAGGLVALLVYDVVPLEYIVGSREALTLPHVLIGLFKGTVYAVLVALAGCRQGLAAGRSAQAVGQATTEAVVQAIVWIVIAASTLTVIFQRLGW